MLDAGGAEHGFPTGDPGMVVAGLAVAARETNDGLAARSRAVRDKETAIAGGYHGSR
jgi:hypothetical protein